MELVPYKKNQSIIQISQLGATAGTLVGSIVFTTTLAGGNFAANTADTGINLVGSGISYGASLITGSITGALYGPSAGLIVKEATGQAVNMLTLNLSRVAKTKIELSTPIGAAAIAVAAAVSTTAGITLAEIIAKQSASGITYITKHAYDRILQYYQDSKHVKLNSYMVGDDLIIDDVEIDESSDEDYIIIASKKSD